MVVMTERTIWACPFCGTELADAQQPHCGKAGRAVEVPDGDEEQQERDDECSR